MLDLKIDTTGIFTSTYDLRLGNVLSTYNTGFAPTPINITNGSIKVSALAIPEPAPPGLMGLSGMTLIRRSRSARR